jgi:hypothetical protein
MNTKVKTRDGRDAIIIDINGPKPDWPIVAWVSYGDGGWYLNAYTASGNAFKEGQSSNDLMLTTYKQRIEQ